MFLVLVYPNGKCVDDRVWKMDEAKAAVRALVELVNGDALQRENELTLELMNTFSSDQVRGGNIANCRYSNVHVRSNRILCRRYT